MYAVIVRAKPGEDLSALSTRLAPVLDLQPVTLATMLGRGFVTVEASLTEEEGMFLTARLQAMGLPAELTAESALAAAPPSQPLPESGPQDATTELGRGQLHALFDEAMEELDDLFLDVEDEEAPAEEALFDRVSVPQREPATSASQGWGALFPDLERPATSPAVAPPPVKPASPSRPVNAAPLSASSLPDFGAEPVLAPPASAPPVIPPRSVALFGAGDEDEVPRGFQDVPPRAPTTGPLPSVPLGGAPAAGSPRQPRAFDGGQLMQAFVSEEQQPPYMPKGFDPRGPHSAELAALLSMVAPGAGQIYNGQDRLALDYGLKFFLIKPWRAGVQQARQRGERIATYWAPRPDEGHLKRVGKYMAAWYLSVVGIVVTSVALVSFIHTQVTRPRITPLSEADLARGVREARLEIQEARIASLDAVSAVMDEHMVRRSQMAPEERVERLFLRGLVECRSNHFPACEATMRRVLELSNNQHRDALRLQTWAALRRQGGANTPMPELSTQVESVAEFEALQQQQESAQQDEPGALDEEGAMEAGATPEEEASQGDPGAPPEE